MHALVINGNIEKYPYSIGELRKDNPQTSFPKNPTNELLSEWNVYPVSRTDRPSHHPVTETLKEGKPVNQNGVWTQVWEVIPASAEQIQQNKESLIASMAGQAQDRLDRFAQSRGYDGILSLCTYTQSGVQKFADEAAYGIFARDETWAILYQILAEVEAGSREVPTSFAEIEPLLPVLNWPNP